MLQYACFLKSNNRCLSDNKMLEQIMGSKGRAAILRHLFDGRCQKSHIRELARLSGLSAPSLMREAKEMVRMGLIRESRDGNRVDYLADVNSPLYDVLRQLVEKTSGVEVVLKKAFADSQANVVFIYGSRARGTERADSDYDLFVIGEEGLRSVSGRVRRAAGTVDVEINPYVIAPDEFRRRQKAGDHFLNEVMSSPKRFLKGGEDELAGLV